MVGHLVICDKEGYCNRALDFFFPQANFFSGLIWFPVGSLVPNAFKFVSFSCSFSLEVTNMAGTAKVPVSNLTKDLFFKRKSFLSFEIVVIFFFS